MTVLEEIRGMKVVAKRYDIEAAAGHLGVKPRTVAKWFRDYDINGLKGQTPEWITYELLVWLAEHIREVDTGKRHFKAICGVPRLTKNGKPVNRIPDLGRWTPKPRELKTYVNGIPQPLKIEAQRLITQGLLPLVMIAPRMGMTRSTVLCRARKLGIKPRKMLCDHPPKSLFDPNEVETAVKLTYISRRGVRPSGRARVKPDDRQLPLFNPDGKVAGRVQISSIHTAASGVFDAPVTPSEIKKSLVKVPGDLAKIAVETLVKAGKYMTAQVSSARLGVHRTTIHVWFLSDAKRKKSIMKFGRISLYPVTLLKVYEAGLKAKAQEKAKKVEEAKAAKVAHMGGSTPELAKAFSKAIRGYKISESERKLLVEFGRLVMLDMVANP